MPPRTASAKFSAALFGAATVLVGCDDAGETDLTVEPGEAETANADGADETLSAVDGQFSTTRTPADQLDPNETPAPDTPDALDEDPGMDLDDAFSGFTNEESAEVPGGDPTMGDSTLGDVTPEDPGKKEYDSAPLAPGEQDG